MSEASATAHAGSRMHVLDWVEGLGGDFVASLNALLHPTGVVVAQEKIWRPKGYADPAEALLDRACEPLLPVAISRRLRSWWLAVDRPTSSGPNWDLAAAATFPGSRPGLVLIEAKAHTGELTGEAGGKRLSAAASANSLRNHNRIAAAIEEARDGLGGRDAGVLIASDSRYQFSNRAAFAWKLAAEGIPVVLIYLGFTGDTVIGRLSDPIRDDAHWRAIVGAHTEGVFPSHLWERSIPIGDTPLWLLIRSLPAHRPSPTNRKRSA